MDRSQKSCVKKEHLISEKQKPHTLSHVFILAGTVDVDVYEWLYRWAKPERR